jgi:hypothetical protein
MLFRSSHLRPLVSPGRNDHGATTAAALGLDTGRASLSTVPPAPAIGCDIGAVTAAEVGCPLDSRAVT